MNSPALRLLLVAVLASLLLIPGQATLPVTDRDEARFVQASRQMLQSGDFIDIRFHDDTRYKKPVGIYWAQSAAAALSGQGAEAPLWVFRLPSLMGIVAAAVLTAWLGSALVGAGPAAFAGLLVAASIVPGVEARLATTDAALLAATLLMQSVLARLWMGVPLRWRAWIFWLGMAAAILLKGPIGPMVVALTAATASLIRRDTAWLRPLLRLWPVLLAVAVTLPWFIAITIISDGAFWGASVGQDMLAKAASAQEGKGAPPGSYVLAMWATFWPGAVLVALTLPAVWAARRRPEIQFLAAWALPGWLVFEAFPTKLVHYTMPMLPALALAACGLWMSPAPVRRWAQAVGTLLLLIGPALLLAFQIWSRRQGADPSNFLLIPVAVTGGIAFVALWQERRVAFLAALIAMGGSVTSGLVLSLAATPSLWPSALALTEARRVSPCKTPRLIGWGYREPSLVWLGGRETLLLDGDAPLPDRLDRCDVVIRSDGGSAPLPFDLHETATLEGYAIGAGRQVRLHVYIARNSDEHMVQTVTD
ncbi:ArnT family glycosyltransferase [Paracoccus aerodenitrificans]|uniref:ArnT family glycosyltransferase n=1 Tax=Paracoccus aerodenitrificans TaxID=3017781 RepID=UPI0022F08F5D|nr:glycosyltransferase family 39 protein [Paracoccus aerodenitrificans]WBU63449.1 glycosyltransferase family 39 protein [Paracoccus aerodenitrificans]